MPIFKRLLVNFSLIAIILSFSTCNQSSLLKTGTKLPDYKGITPTGDTVNLHDYIGEKIILVNFWAGWCGDCLKHNPELVALYDKYKDFEINGKHFDIVSISLDKKQAQWLNTISHQNLYWNHHIADMDGYDSEQLKKFNIIWIPSNYLVDENGIILATNVDRSNFEDIVRKHYN